MAWVVNIPCKVIMGRVRSRNMELEPKQVYSNWKTVTNAILNLFREYNDPKVLFSERDFKKFWSMRIEDKLQEICIDKKEIIDLTTILNRIKRVATFVPIKQILADRGVSIDSFKRYLSDQFAKMDFTTDDIVIPISDTIFENPARSVQMPSSKTKLKNINPEKVHIFESKETPVRMEFNLKDGSSKTMILKRLYEESPKESMMELRFSYFLNKFLRYLPEKNTSSLPSIKNMLYSIVMANDNYLVEHLEGSFDQLKSLSSGHPQKLKKLFESHKDETQRKIETHEKNGRDLETTNLISRGVI